MTAVAPQPTTHPHAERCAQLRAVAAWLESHPEAHVTDIAFIKDEVSLQNFRSWDLASILADAAAIGGAWETADYADNFATFSQQIAPGAYYRFYTVADR